MRADDHSATTRAGSDGLRRRTRRAGKRRSCRIAISVDESELAELEAAAAGERLTVSAFVANCALRAARGAPVTVTAPLREALAELSRATSQVQRAGTNFNQAVAALNTTGQVPGNLVQYARYAAAVISRLDAAAAEVMHRLP